MVNGNSLATMYVDQTTCSTPASRRAGRDNSSAILLTCDRGTNNTHRRTLEREGQGRNQLRLELRVHLAGDGH